MGKRSFTIAAVFIAAAISVSACGERKTTEPQPKTMKETITKLEQEGKYPVLDRTETLLGEDKDGNGVRDDIDAYIDSLPDTTEQKAALRQTGEAFNYVLSMDITNPNQIAKYHYMSEKSLNCLYEKYGDDERSNRLGRTIQAFTFNTRSRIEAYLDLNRAINGTSWKSPQEGCDEKFNK